MARYALRKKSTGTFAKMGTQYPTPSLVYDAPSLNEAKIYRSRSGGPSRTRYVWIDNDFGGESRPNPEWDDLEWVEVELRIVGES